MCYPCDDIPLSQAGRLIPTFGRKKNKDGTNIEPQAKQQQSEKNENDATSKIPPIPTELENKEPQAKLEQRENNESVPTSEISPIPTELEKEEPEAKLQQREKNESDAASGIPPIPTELEKEETQAKLLRRQKDENDVTSKITVPTELEKEPEAQLLQSEKNANDATAKLPPKLLQRQKDENDVTSKITVPTELEKEETEAKLLQREKNENDATSGIPPIPTELAKEENVPQLHGIPDQLADPNEVHTHHGTATLETQDASKEAIILREEIVRAENDSKAKDLEKSDTDNSEQGIEKTSEECNPGLSTSSLLNLPKEISAELGDSTLDAMKGNQISESHGENPKSSLQPNMAGEKKTNVSDSGNTAGVSENQAPDSDVHSTITSDLKDLIKENSPEAKSAELATGQSEDDGVVVSDASNQQQNPGSATSPQSKNGKSLNHNFSSFICWIY